MQAGLPDLAAILGLCEDGMPLVLSFEDPTPGSLLVAGGDGQIVVWDTHRWEIVHVIDRFRLMGQTLAITPDGRHIATGSEAGLVVWNLDNGRAARTWSSNGPIDRGHLQALRSMRAGPRSPCPTEVRDRCQSIRESTGFACQ